MPWVKPIITHGSRPPSSFLTFLISDGPHIVTEKVTLCVPLLMQPIKELTRLLWRLASEEHYLFSLDDMRSALPEASPGAFKVLISRAEKSGLLEQVCRGVYLYPRVSYPPGLVIYHTAAKLRVDGFNCLSLETVLIDAGVISQIPKNWILLMSSGRSHIFELLFLITTLRGI